MKPLADLQFTDVICAMSNSNTYVKHRGDGEACKTYVDPRRVDQLLQQIQQAEREGKTITPIIKCPFGGYGCETPFASISVWMLVQTSFDFPDPEMPLVSHQFGFCDAS